MGCLWQNSSWNLFSISTQRKREFPIYFKKKFRCWAHHLMWQLLLFNFNPLPFAISLLNELLNIPWAFNLGSATGSWTPLVANNIGHMTLLCANFMELPRMNKLQDRW
jgi:hypothetical protein